MIKDVLVGVAISWLTLTEDGKRFQKKAAKYIVDRYLLPKADDKSEEATVAAEKGGGNDDGTAQT